jgi:hypothetical protein
MHLLKEDLEAFMNNPETKKKLDDVAELLWREKQKEVGAK